MTRPRTVLALDLAAQGLTSTEIAAELGGGVTPAAVRDTLRRHGAPHRRPGRPPTDPTTGPVTPASRRGRAALARLVAIADARRVTVEAVLDAVEADRTPWPAAAPPPDCRACGGDGRRWDGARFVREVCPECQGDGAAP